MDIDFFGWDIHLQNDRVLLRPLEAGDLEKLESIAYHPSIWEMGTVNISSKDQLQKYIRNALEERKNNLSYPFIIYDKLNGSFAGSTRFGTFSFPNKRLEIGWTWLHPDYQRSGLNRHCKYILLQYAFEVLGMHRVEFKTDVLNLQSRNAILGIGAKKEGIFRKHMITETGRIRDSIYFSIIDEEWPGIKIKLEEGLR